MFGLTVVTEPATEPLELAEARRQCRIADEHPGIDVELSALIAASRRYCERATQKAFVTQELMLTRDCFPGSGEDYQFALPRPPLQTLTADVTWPDLGIFYTDSDGVEQMVDAATYVVDSTTEVGRIALAFGESWPTDAIEQIGSVRVQYLAGYGAAADVPETIKHAMRLLIGHWYLNKEAAADRSIEPVAMAVNSLLGVEWTGSIVGAYG